MTSSDERNTRYIDSTAWFGTVSQFTAILETLEKALVQLAKQENEEVIASLEKELEKNKTRLDDTSDQTASGARPMSPYEAVITRNEYEIALHRRDSAIVLDMVATRPRVRDEISGSAATLGDRIAREPYDSLTVTFYGSSPYTSRVDLKADRRRGLSINISSASRQWSNGTIKELEDTVRRGTPWFGRQLTSFRWLFGALTVLGGVAFLGATVTSDALRAFMSSLVAMPVGFIGLFALFVMLPAAGAAAIIHRVAPLFALNLGAETPFRDRQLPRMLFGIGVGIINVALALAPALLFPAG
ncbi:hypothetical protein [Citricoccus zhacaiensis]|uniref:hypothetical protein n=1 Tax=Citricoccus zhacaiensis TaxID=489142 RepID=UPI001666995A|nr:hypothetical protein [Citricoccus zhacaiensis]